MPKALRRRYGYMAFNRETFKDRIEEYLRGAVIEFYKGRIATKNSRSGRSVFWTRNETRWVEHWTTEVRMLIDRFGATIGDHDIRGFKDRRKAIAEVIERLKSKDDGFRRRALSIVQKDFGRDMLLHADDTDSTAFWAEVDASIDACIKDGFMREPTTQTRRGRGRKS